MAERLRAWGHEVAEGLRADMDALPIDGAGGAYWVLLAERFLIPQPA